MHYAILFGICAVAIGIPVIANGGWFWLLSWPSLSLALVAYAYGTCSPRVFGKQVHGRVSPVSTTLLLPFLLFLRGTWHVQRLISRERPYDAVLPNVTIGRRLLQREFPDDFSMVVDLTCEFVASLPVESIEYHSFPILDATAPGEAELFKLIDLLRRIPTDRVVYVHCANGHGRTGLAAALIVMLRNKDPDAVSALAHVRACRKGVSLAPEQRRSLKRAAEILAE